MNKIFKSTLIIGLLWQNTLIGQSIINIYPDTLHSIVNVNLTPGVFYVPKTNTAANDFMGNGIQQNSIRTNVIESVLNNTTDLASCLALLNTVKAVLQDLSLKCEKLIFIFEKMPLWLSSSSDPTPAIPPGWHIYNTKPPADWNIWQTVVDSITSKIVNEFGLSNAYIEVWNEPDLGSWTGTMSEYFMLYKRTYDGIKSANPYAKVGGPSVNFWANNIYWKPPFGYISNTNADLSLIGQLLDSTVIWNKIPDFISWHNFNIFYQEFTNASNYIEQKLASLSVPQIPFIISEWNANSDIRDTRLALSYMIKVQLEFSKTPISNNAIAAWQDFAYSTNEFHHDYGLLTYGAIHKPTYNSILLSGKLKGKTCKMNSTSLYDGISSVIDDTLFILISNYCPPPFYEAAGNTLYQGHFTLNQLDSAGYIDLSSNSIFPLDSIYRGLIIIPNTDAMQIAINNSIPTYQHYDSIDDKSRQFNIVIDGHLENYPGQLYIIDSTQNNMQFKYDSLRAAGHSQSSAISLILLNQNLIYSAISFNSGQYSINMQPNSVCFFKINIPGISDIKENILRTNSFIIYPNPASEKLTISFLSPRTNIVEIYDIMGRLTKTVFTNQTTATFNVYDLPNGLYFIRMKDFPNQTQKFLKQ